MLKTIHYWYLVIKLRYFFKKNFNKSNVESLELAKKTAKELIYTIYEL
jgi:hypothetical protein